MKNFRKDKQWQNHKLVQKQREYKKNTKLCRLTFTFLQAIKANEM